MVDPGLDPRHSPLTGHTARLMETVNCGASRSKKRPRHLVIYYQNARVSAGRELAVQLLLLLRTIILLCRAYGNWSKYHDEGKYY